MAGSFKISAAITALDRMSRPVRRISMMLTTRLGGAFRLVGRTARAASRSTAALGRGLRRVGVAAGVGAGAAAAAMNQYIQKGDELGKLSRQLGLNVESLQEWRFAADRMGVSSATFETSMGAFSKRLGEARTGQGALLQMLNKTGPAFKNQILNAGSTEEALQLYIAAMRKVEDPALKAALASSAFSRAGMRMTRFADQSAESIQGLRDEKRKLGVITEDEAAATEDAADKLANFKAAIGGVGVMLAGKFLGPITKSLEAMTNWITTAEIAEGSVLEAVFEAIGDAVRSIDFESIWRSLQQAWAILRPTVMAIVNAIRDNWRTIRDVTTAIFSRIALIIGIKIAAILSIVRGFAENFGAIWASVKTVLNGFLTFFSGVFMGDTKTMVDGLGVIWVGLKNLLLGVWAAIKTAAINAFTTIDKLILKFAPDPIKKAWGSLKDFFAQLWPEIVAIFEKSMDKILGWVDDIKDAVDSVVDAGRSVGESLGILDKQVRLNFDIPAIQSITAPAAAAPSAVAAASGSTSVNSNVEVTFRNAPAELAVTRTRTDGPGNVKTNVGRRTAGAGAN